MIDDTEQAAPPDGAKTHFGYTWVEPEEKTRRVREVFDSVAARYDLMNDLMSGGLHRLWKAAFVTWLRPRADMSIVDLAGGTGDIAFRIKRAGGGDVVVTDINYEMLRVGQERAARRGVHDGLSWLCANGESLPFADGRFDAVTCAFGIRNITKIDFALAEIRRILKPGGRFLCLEFSRLVLPGISPAYETYSFKVLPKLGELVARDGESYRYLVESIRQFPDQDTFAGMMRQAGLDNVVYRNLAGGIAAMHSGWRI